MTVLDQIGESFGGAVQALTERDGVDWESAAAEISKAVGELHDFAAEARVPVGDVPGAPAMMELLRGLQTKDPRVTYEAVRAVKDALPAMVKYINPEEDLEDLGADAYSEFSATLDGIEGFVARAVMARRAEIGAPGAKVGAFRKVGLDILDAWGEAPERQRAGLVSQWDSYYRQADVRSGLSWLEDEGYIRASKRPEGRGPVAYKITPKGLRRLMRKARKAVGESLMESIADLYHVAPGRLADLALSGRGLGSATHQGERVYLASDAPHAAAYAQQDFSPAWKGETRAVLFAVPMSALDPSRLIPDDDDYPDILNQLGDDSGYDPDSWQDSLAASGQVIYKGVIPSSALTVVREWSLGQRDESREPSFLDLVQEQVVKLKGGLGHSREKLPQIPGEKVGEFLAWLKEKGVSSSQKKLPVKSLKPSQGELEMDKVDSMAAKPAELRSGDPIITSKDSYVMDGHHRWGAFRKALPDEEIPAIVVDLPIKELIQIANTWSGTENRSVKEGFRALLAKRLGEDWMDDAQGHISTVYPKSEGQAHAKLGFLLGQLEKQPDIADSMDFDMMVGHIEAREWAAAREIAREQQEWEQDDGPEYAAAARLFGDVAALLDRIMRSDRLRGAGARRGAGVDAATAVAELDPQLYRAAAKSLADDLEGAIWVDERRKPTYATRPGDEADHGGGAPWVGAWVPVWVSTRWLKMRDSEEGDSDSTWDWAMDYGFDLRLGNERKTYRNNYGVPFTMVRGALFVPNASAEAHEPGQDQLPLYQRRQESIQENLLSLQELEDEHRRGFLVSRTQLVDHHNSASRGPNGRVALFVSKRDGVNPPAQVGHTDGPIVEGRTTVRGIPYQTAVIRSPHWGALYPSDQLEQIQ